MLTTLRRMRRGRAKGKQHVHPLLRDDDELLPTPAASEPAASNHLHFDDPKLADRSPTARRPRFFARLRPRSNTKEEVSCAPFRMRSDPANVHARSAAFDPFVDDKPREPPLPFASSPSSSPAKSPSPAASPAQRTHARPKLVPLDDEFDALFDREAQLKLGTPPPPPPPPSAPGAAPSAVAAEVRGEFEPDASMSDARPRADYAKRPELGSTPPPFTARRDAEFMRREADAGADLLPPAAARNRAGPSLRFARRHRSAMPSATDLDRAPHVEGNAAVRPMRSNAYMSADTLLSANGLLKAGGLRFNSLNTHYGHQVLPHVHAAAPDMVVKNSTNPMRPVLVSDARQSMLRASMTAPHPTVTGKLSKHSNGGGSFWFAERRKPRSRLLSAFSLRKGSRLSLEPPPIANTPEIPWARPGAIDDDDEESVGTADDPDLSTSLLNFFGQRPRGPAPTPLSSPRDGDAAKGSAAIRRIFPFAGRRSPVPAAARKQATAMEEALQKSVEEAASRPSDLSTINLEQPAEKEDKDDASEEADPADFDVDEYSSLHSALAAMLNERSNTTGFEDDLLGEDVRLKKMVKQTAGARRTKVHEKQVQAGKVRYKSTSAIRSSSRNVMNECAFSGPVLAFSLTPQNSASVQPSPQPLIQRRRTSDVPLAPTVYGPGSNDALPLVMSQFSDPVSSDTTQAMPQVESEVSVVQTPVISRNHLDVPSDNELLPESASYVRVSSGATSTGFSSQHASPNVISNNDIPSATSDLVGHHAVPKSAGTFEGDTAVDDGDDDVPLANSMDASRLYANASVSSAVATDAKPPTVEDVRRLARAALPDMVPVADQSPSIGAVTRRRLPSEPTFTTFSETSREWTDGGRSSMELASDVPSLSSDMFNDAPSSFASRRTERTRGPELYPPSPSPVANKWRRRAYAPAGSKAGIVYPAPLYDMGAQPVPLPRAQTATVLQRIVPVVEREVATPWSPSEPLVSDDAPQRQPLDCQVEQRAQEKSKPLDRQVEQRAQEKSKPLGSVSALVAALERRVSASNTTELGPRMSHPAAHFPAAAFRR